MSVQRVRRWARGVAAVLLLAAVPGLPHLAEDDVACVPVAVEHDESRHGIGAGTQPAGEHCAVCHWARSLRAPRAALTPGVTDIARQPLVPRAAGSVHVAPALESLPARAPPAPRV